MGVRCNKLALSWKYLEDMVKNQVAVNEVEREAWNRGANREVKKGRDRPRNKGRYCEKFQRDRIYIGKQMKIRAQQAKEDWMEERKHFMNLKRKLMDGAKTERERNSIKRDVENLK